MQRALRFLPRDIQHYKSNLKKTVAQDTTLKKLDIAEILQSALVDHPQFIAAYETLVNGAHCAIFELGWITGAHSISFGRSRGIYR